MTDPAVDPVDSLLRVLELADSGARTSEDIFTGVSEPMPHGRIYGGQVLAQAVVAASRTVAAERAVHSMHGYFLRPGDAAAGLTLSVDRIHDGRSFSTRRTQAYQAGVPIFSMIASFQDADTGAEHQVDMPSVPGPDGLPDAMDGLREHLASPRAQFFTERPFEFRYLDEPIYVSANGPLVPHQAVWVRARRRLPDDAWVHRAALAYLSDMSIQDSILRAHGVAWATPGLKVASLDHAMWWHRDARVDDWLLYAQESPSAQGGRGLSEGRIFTRDGVLIASVAQEVMVRVPAAD